VSDYVRLHLVPVSQVQARQYITEVHRHNDAPQSSSIRLSVGIADESDTLRGVACLGRPVARMLDDGRTAEVLRVATDGVRNGASMLYGALVRAAWAIGYTRIVTYTLEAEPGTSLRAAGWTYELTTKDRDTAHDWASRDGRSGAKPTLFFEDKVPTGPKVRWVIERKVA
jgi:hypothetical protein